MLAFWLTGEFHATVPSNKSEFQSLQRFGRERDEREFEWETFRRSIVSGIQNAFFLIFFIVIVAKRQKENALKPVQALVGGGTSVKKLRVYNEREKEQERGREWLQMYFMISFSRTTTRIESLLFCILPDRKVENSHLQGTIFCFDRWAHWQQFYRQPIRCSTIDRHPLGRLQSLAKTENLPLSRRALCLKIWFVVISIQRLGCSRLDFQTLLWLMRLS